MDLQKKLGLRKYNEDSSRCISILTSNSDQKDHGIISISVLEACGPILKMLVEINKLKLLGVSGYPNIL